MACFVVLTGSLVDQVFDLHPTATLTLGSGPNNHIQLPEADVAELHAQVYPAQGRYWFQDLGYGYTLVNARDVSQTVHPLDENDVVQLGRTFLRFLFQPPAGVATGGLTELQHQLTSLREEAMDATKRLAQLESTKDELARRLESSRSAESAASREAKKLARENEKLTGDNEALRGELATLGAAAEEKTQLEDEGVELRAERDRLKREVAEKERLEARVAELEAELGALRDARGEADRRGAEVEELEAERRTLLDQVADRRRLEGEVAALTDELTTLKDELAARERLGEELVALRAELEPLRGAQADNDRLSIERADLLAQLDRLREELAVARAEDAREELDDTRAALDEARAALAALGVPAAATALARADEDDPGAILDAAGLSPELARRLEASLTRFAERESLRRLGGATPTAAPLAEAGDIERELRTLRERATRLASALDLMGSD
ncbi:MAG: FHA domain-containing protein [Myxococcales bacterium]|nr:FHA domain-containing protein [Myxococcales bacterium]